MGDTAAKWARLAGLSGWQWWVLLTAPFALFATWVSLRFTGYRATLARCQPARPSGLEKEAELEAARDTAFALAVATKYGPWRPRCLLRSLALARYLGRRGIASELRIGLPSGTAIPMSSSAPDFSAHVWVECHGAVLNDRDDIADQFRPFDAPSGQS